MTDQGFGRRDFLKTAVVGGAAAAATATAIPAPSAQAQQPAAPPAAEGYEFLNLDEAAFVEALVDHMVPEVVSCLDQNAPFPVAAARLFSAGTASTHLESCNGLPTAERLYRSLRYSLTGPRNGSPAWCIIAAVAAPAAVIRMLAPRRGVVPTSVAPLVAGRCFFATSQKP